MNRIRDRVNRERDEGKRAGEEKDVRTSMCWKYQDSDGMRWDNIAVYKWMGSGGAEVTRTRTAARFAIGYQRLPWISDRWETGHGAGTVQQFLTTTALSISTASDAEGNPSRELSQLSSLTLPWWRRLGHSPRQYVSSKPFAELAEHHERASWTRQAKDEVESAWPKKNRLQPLPGAWD